MAEEPMDAGEKISAMLHGPLNFRFVVQPLIALLLGLRDGHKDHQAGNPPYLFGLFTKKESRRDRLRAGLKAVAMPLSLAFVMDAIVQSLLFERIRLLSLLVVGTLLVAFPYVLMRGFSNRGLSRAHRHA